MRRVLPKTTGEEGAAPSSLLTCDQLTMPQQAVLTTLRRLWRVLHPALRTVLIGSHERRDLLHGKRERERERESARARKRERERERESVWVCVLRAAPRKCTHRGGPLSLSLSLSLALSYFRALSLSLFLPRVASGEASYSDTLRRACGEAAALCTLRFGASCARGACFCFVPVGVGPGRPAP